MKNMAIMASLALPLILSGCYSSTERVVAAPAPQIVAAPAPIIVERHVYPETTTTIMPAPSYAAPGTVTTTTRRDTVIENRY